MKKFEGYEKARVMTDRERLPIGGYVVKILDAEELTYSWGSVLAISIDIEEGEYKGYYQQDYDLQNQEDKKWKGVYRLSIPKEDGSEMDEWSANIFKTAIAAIEDSNTGYHWDWDEKKLKGKVVGALFRNKEYELNGVRGFFTECSGFRPVEIIKSGKFKVPKDKLLKKKEEPVSGFTPATMFDDDDCPF
ncbi:MAG: hypothetical protein HFI90_06945 [Clostridia bacterium]|nr:hypothetical protein [Clostridia bacterium]